MTMHAISAAYPPPPLLARPPHAGQGTDAQSEGAAAAEAGGSELAALRKDVRELRQLLLAALGHAPAGTGAGAGARGQGA